MQGVLSTVHEDKGTQPSCCLQQFSGWLSKYCNENPRMYTLLVGTLKFAHARILVTIFEQPT